MPINKCNGRPSSRCELRLTCQLPQSSQEQVQVPNTRAPNSFTPRLLPLCGSRDSWSYFPISCVTTPWIPVCMAFTSPPSLVKPCWLALSISVSFGLPPFWVRDPQRRPGSPKAVVFLLRCSVEKRHQLSQQRLVSFPRHRLVWLEGRRRHVSRPHKCLVDPAQARQPAIRELLVAPAVPSTRTSARGSSARGAVATTFGLPRRVRGDACKDRWCASLVAHHALLAQRQSTTASYSSRVVASSAPRGEGSRPASSLRDVSRACAFAHQRTLLGSSWPSATLFGRARWAGGVLEPRHQVADFVSTRRTAMCFAM